MKSGGGGGAIPYTPGQYTKSYYEQRMNDISAQATRAHDTAESQSKSDIDKAKSDSSQLLSPLLKALSNMMDVSYTGKDGNVAQPNIYQAPSAGKTGQGNVTMLGKQMPGSTLLGG